MLKGFLIAYLFLFAYSTHSYERADAFIVKVYDDLVRVLSPTKYDPKLAVVIENKTLTKIVGKVETSSGQVLAYVAVEAGKFTSVNVKRLKTDKVYFIPTAPPLQKVELKLGNKPYEIPPKQ